MRLKLKAIRLPQVVEDQSPARSAIIWCVLGFVGSYAYTVYDESDVLIDYFLFADYKINFRAHVYYMGERFRWIAYSFAISAAAPCWQTSSFLIMAELYFWDYFFFFNDTWYGRSMGIAMIVILLITLWKRR